MPELLTEDAWRAMGASSRGKTHDANGLPNQDAFAFNTNGGTIPLVVAVSDGHGGEAYFRSDVGSRFAVDAALEVLQRPPSDTELASALVRAWLRRVEEHLREHPFTPKEELIQARQTWGADPVEAYGSTMLALAVYDRDILYVQLGDGDLLRVGEDGATTRIFYKDPRLAVNETHSLCDPEADSRVQLRRDPRNGHDPALLIAATDGFGNSFANDGDFLMIGHDLLQMIRERGIDEVGNELPRMLKETSDTGSRDDITIGVLVAPTPVAPGMGARSATQTYEHRQFSPWVFLVLAIVAFAFVRFGLAGPGLAARMAAFAVLAAVAVCFSTLSTRVDDRGISWAFAFGKPGGSIAYNDIADARITATRFWEGYGIHWTLQHGWLWNVGGSEAVMIRKRDGRIVTLGTDDPQNLYNAIQSLLRPA